MGLVTEIILLPLAPVRGVAWVARQLEDEARRESGDGSDLETELAELDRQRAQGEITPEEADAREEELLDWALDNPDRGGTLDD